MYCYTFKDKYGTQKDAISYPPIGNLTLKAANDYLRLSPYFLSFFFFYGSFFRTFGIIFKIKKDNTQFLYIFFSFNFFYLTIVEI